MDFNITWTMASFLGCLFVFLAIGLASARFAQHSREDYYVASNSVKPWLVGLSAVATNNSGYMFIGVMGYTYANGLSSVWLMIGWIVGDLLASLLVHRRLREASTDHRHASYVGLLSTWDRDRTLRSVELVASLATLGFLLAYSSAQLTAGSKALHVLFSWPMWAGAVMGAILIGVYCIAGGIRASIWTDAAQSFVMIVAMAVMLYTGIQAVGGLDGAWGEMQAVPGFTEWFPARTLIPGTTGAVLFVVGWLFAGVSVLGQPHIMVRFMTLDNPKHMWRARAWYYSWFTGFYAMATAVGLLSRIYLSNPGTFDPELALPMIARDLLPAPLTGLVLAGIFAATMSTADSLILSCSATVTQDLFGKRMEHGTVIKLATVSCTLIALLMALGNSESVFTLVILAWSGLASCFAPLLIVHVLGGRPTSAQAVTMMVAGLLVDIGWRHLGLAGSVYEGMPGIIAGLAAWPLSQLLTRSPAPVRADVTAGD